jgi:hypothetical protein
VRNTASSESNPRSLVTAPVFLPVSCQPEGNKPSSTRQSSSTANMQAIIRAIVGGERDPMKLAQLRNGMIRASEEEIARSLEGNWREDILFELGQVLEAYDFQQKQITGCDERLKKYIGEQPTREASGGLECARREVVAEPKKRGPKKKHPSL